MTLDTDVSGYLEFKEFAMTGVRPKHILKRNSLLNMFQLMRPDA